MDLVQSLPRMLRFKVERTVISDDVLIEMAVRWRLLEALDLTRCANISARESATSLRSAFALRELNLSETRLAEDFLESLRRQYPKAKIVLKEDSFSRIYSNVSLYFII